MSERGVTVITEEILGKIARAEMIIFGSGPSAYAFDYSAAGINGVNLAMTPSAFALETALIKEYTRYFRKECAAVFAICPFSFAENRDNANAFRYEKYHAVLSKRSMDSLPAPGSCPVGRTALPHLRNERYIIPPKFRRRIRHHTKQVYQRSSHRLRQGTALHGILFGGTGCGTDRLLRCQILLRTIQIGNRLFPTQI